MPSPHVSKWWPLGRNAFRTALVVVGLLAWVGPAMAQTAAADSPVSSLKQLSLDELLDIEVTSVSKHPEKLLEAAAAIQVITGEDIRRSGATSIPEALRLAGNLQVAQKDSRAWGISARGFNTDLANKLLVLMDGRAVYTPLYSGVFWPRQDYLLADLDRIEVISGPGSTLWGANAVNGVINITSRSAKDTQGLLWEAGGGSELRGSTAVRYGGTLAPGVYYRIYGKYSDRADSVLPNGAGSGDAWSTGQGGFRIDAVASPQATFTVQGDVYSNHEDMATGGISRESGHNLLGRWSRTLPGDADVSLQLYYDHTHLVLPTTPFVINGLTLAPAGTLHDDLDTYDLDFQHRFRAGSRQQFVWGLGYRFTHDVVGNSPGLAFLPPKLDQNLFSGFVQDEIALRKNLTLTLGTKLEHNDYTGQEIEPGLRLQWQAAPERLLWAAVSRAVRMPSRIDRDLSEPAPGAALVVLKGGAEFDSETVVAYEVGYRAQLSRRLGLSAAAFYNEYRDLRSTSITPVTVVPFFFANNLEGETHGVEVAVDYQLTAGWRLHGSYNLLEEHLHIKPGQMDLNHGLNETADPRQQFSLRSALDLPRGWELDTALRWVDTLAINNGGVPATVPSYAELDVRLGWHPTRALELALTGQNLLHDRHLEYGVPGPARPEVSRSIYGKATWRF